MKSLSILILATGLALSATSASAQSEPQIGETFMWDGVRWVSISLPPQNLPVAAPQPVWTPPPAPAVRAPAPAPARTVSVGLQPSWLLGVFR